MLELTTSSGLLVPSMLAVTGATLVARLLDAQSTYSGRIALRALATVLERHSVSTPFDDLVSHTYDVIAASEPYAQVLAALERVAPASLYVVDEQGRLSGSIDRADVIALQNRSASLPLSTLLAGDLAHGGPCVNSAMSKTEVLGRRDCAKGMHLRVIDKSSGRLIGIIQADLGVCLKPEPPTS